MIDRYCGAPLGPAAGDAVGTTLEFDMRVCGWTDVALAEVEPR